MYQAVTKKEMKLSWLAYDFIEEQVKPVNAMRIAFQKSSGDLNYHVKTSFFYALA